MASKEKKFITIHLTDWQRGMVKDLLHKDCHSWEVFVDVPVIKDNIRSSTKTCVTKMYLTDWQKKEIRAEAGICLEYIELEKEITQTIKLDKNLILSLI
jgi:hypothetical protein